MGMKAGELAYRYVIAHLLPGVLALYPVSLVVPWLGGAIGSVVTSTQSWGGSAIAVAFVSLILGLTLDAIRYISIDLVLTRVFYGSGSPKYLSRIRTEDDAKFVDGVIDGSYAYYQFYWNSAIALLGFIAVWNAGLASPPSGQVRSLCLATLMFFAVAGTRACYSAALRLSRRFDQEGFMSNGPGVPRPTPPAPPAPGPGPSAPGGGSASKSDEAKPPGVTESPKPTGQQAD